MIDGLSGEDFDGVFISEQDVTGVARLQRCVATSNVQNTHIDKLKRQLVMQAMSVGANAILNFRYSQRANFMSFSSVTWEASGDAVLIPLATTSRAEGSICSSCSMSLSPGARFCRNCGVPTT